MRPFTGRGRLAFDQATFDCPDNDLGTRGEAKLVENIADVSLHGALGNPQPLGNLTTGFALSHQCRHLSFTRCQAVIFCSFKEVIWVNCSRSAGSSIVVAREAMIVRAASNS